MKQYNTILCETPAERVGRVTLNRPETRNAQNLEMLYELDDALKAMCGDKGIHVIIIAAAGKDFSSGHDLTFSSGYDPEKFNKVTQWGEFDLPGAEGFYATEREIYLELTERWRNLPKPLIAQVQGRCIAGGNMIAWASDIIIAGQGASFQDNTALMGMCGVEFFNHPYEMPVRKAKEFLFAGDPLSAEDARQLGMVNIVAPDDELEQAALAFAEKVAAKPLFALKTSKMAMNKAQDQMGRRELMETAFTLHQLCHAHNMIMHKFPIDYTNLHPKVRESIKQYIEEMDGNPFGYFPEE